MHVVCRLVKNIVLLFKHLLILYIHDKIQMFYNAHLAEYLIGSCSNLIIRSNLCPHRTEPFIYCVTSTRGQTDTWTDILIKAYQLKDLS